MFCLSFWCKNNFFKEELYMEIDLLKCISVDIGLFEFSVHRASVWTDIKWRKYVLYHFPRGTH